MRADVGRVRKAVWLLCLLLSSSNVVVGSLVAIRLSTELSPRGWCCCCFALFGPSRPNRILTTDLPLRLPRTSIPGIARDERTEGRHSYRHNPFLGAMAATFVPSQFLRLHNLLHRAVSSPSSSTATGSGSNEWYVALDGLRNDLVDLGRVKPMDETEKKEIEGGE